MSDCCKDKMYIYILIRQLEKASLHHLPNSVFSVHC